MRKDKPTHSRTPKRGLGGEWAGRVTYTGRGFWLFWRVNSIWETRMHTRAKEGGEDALEYYASGKPRT